MIFPIRTDRALKHTPWVNYALIGLNVLIFIMTRQDVAEARILAERGMSAVELFQRYPVLTYYLRPGMMHLYQFITYQFLHADMMHLIGNMVFLYVFGNSVEDRLGKVGYIFFYLGAGVFAGVGHAAVEVSPVLGASGAIAGVTGAYLALFPLSNVTLVYWMFIIGSFEVSGMLLILFRVAQDALMQLFGSGGVAYLAHLAGYSFGFTVGMGLLLVRIIAREPYDMLSLIEHRRRRSQFRRLSKGGFHPWESAGRKGSPKGKIAQNADAAITTQERLLMEKRAQISAALSRHDLPGAAKGYTELLKLDSTQVMSQQQQLDLANQLMSEGSYDTAGAAYELFLGIYGTYPEKHHVQLIMGLIYSRYLDQPQRARVMLASALDRLEGEDKKLAKQILEQIPPETPETPETPHS